MKKIVSFLLFMAIAILLFLKRNESLVVIDNYPAPSRGIATEPDKEIQHKVSKTVEQQSKQAERKRTSSQDVDEERKILIRVPAEVQNFKKQNKHRDATSVVKKNILNNKAFKVGKVSISPSLRATAIGGVNKGNDIIGELNGLTIFSDNPTAALEPGQFFVAFDHEKNSIAFFSGRLIVQTSDSFDESLLENLKFEVAEKSENNQSLKFLEFRGSFSDFDEARKNLIKLEGVASVRAELIYGRKTRQ